MCRTTRVWAAEIFKDVSDKELTSGDLQSAAADHRAGITFIRRR